ncbi:MAG: polyribonucleotide nucleotidyltransferase [Candidatus Kerfeldbacteria bacterium]
MHNAEQFSVEWGGKTLSIETGKLAGLANGSARVQYGDTVVLATVAMSGDVREGIDYFPLMVDFEENLYAAGKIKGSRFIKREGRPSDKAVLNARITDRSLRPLFDYRIRNDIQVILNVMSVDHENDPDYVALIAASAALTISDIPWDGPIVGLTVGYVDGEYVLNPTSEQRAAAELNLMMAVKEDHIVMIEADGTETSEEITFGGFEFALKQGKPVVDLINQMKEKVGKEKIEPTVDVLTEEEQKMHDEVEAKSKAYMDENIESLFGIRSKLDRGAKEAEVKTALLGMFASDEEKAIAGKVYDEHYEEAFRSLMLEKEVRVDGRALDEVRELYAEVDMLPRTHGSALFQRGETQVLSTVTLGSPGDAQIIDGLEPEYKKRYMHHYNFPPFSVGETRPLRGPSRRDIGHGMLAEKALEPVLPPKEDFPYTIRVVSEVLMSNGSSSQASACCSTLSLMAAGVPITRPVAGIAMGLVMTEDQKTYKILTDIQGVEDHSGDMDFKVAGTAEGVTAIQLDIKLGGITLDICRDTLEQAKKARLQILEVMTKAIAEPRKEMSPYAPRIETIMIDPEKIGDVIGPGGKIINKIIEETEVQIDIEDDGQVFITSVDGEGMEKAMQMVKDIVREVEVGEEYEGEILQIMKDRMSGKEIGAIVDLGGGKDGMIHVSNICNKRINNVSDVLKAGEMVKVKVVEVDKEKGRIGLSRKDLIQAGLPDPVCDAAPEMTELAGGRGYGRDDRRGGGGGRPRGGRNDYRRDDRRGGGRPSGPRQDSRGPRGPREDRPTPPPAPAAEEKPEPKRRGLFGRRKED